MNRRAFLVLLTLACSQEVDIAPEVTEPASAVQVAPPATNGCGWPYSGSIVVPALPAGMACYYASVPAAAVHRSAILMRNAPTWCGHGNLTASGAACSMRGCIAIGNVLAGQIVDVWSLDASAAALGSVVLAPTRSPSACRRGARRRGDGPTTNGGSSCACAGRCACSAGSIAKTSATVASGRRVESAR